jgi:predicted Zn-dependent protease
MNQCLEHLKSALDKHPELKYSLDLSLWQTDFLRFYQSQTNYNISKEMQKLNATIYKGKKSCSFEINHPDVTKVDSALVEALQIIDALPEDPDFVDLENDLRLAPPREVVNNIEAIDLKHKTGILTKLAKNAAEHDFELYGTFICNYSSTRIVNSNGLDKSSTHSPIYLEVKAVHRSSQVTVLETFGGDDFRYFDFETFNDRLMAKIANTKNPVVDVEPGEYEVILAPRCVAEFVSYLSYAMNAHSLDQHSSYFEDKAGQKVFPDHISITDDPHDPEMIRQDYGSGGHLYETMALIDKGVFKGFLCDQYYHFKLGLPKNGNTAACLKIAPGHSTLEGMMANVKRGLYISSLHYMNLINAKETSLTGLTRDGTFLIEDGRITAVVNNLRFTEKISRILENTLELEDKAYTIPFSDNYADFDVSTVKAPHARISTFNITSSTKTI